MCRPSHGTYNNTNRIRVCALPFSLATASNTPPPSSSSSPPPPPPPKATQVAVPTRKNWSSNSSNDSHSYRVRFHHVEVITIPSRDCDKEKPMNNQVQERKTFGLEEFEYNRAMMSRSSVVFSSPSTLRIKKGIIGNTNRKKKKAVSPTSSLKRWQSSHTYIDDDDILINPTTASSYVVVGRPSNKKWTDKKYSSSSATKGLVMPAHPLSPGFDRMAFCPPPKQPLTLPLRGCRPVFHDQEFPSVPLAVD